MKTMKTKKKQKKKTPKVIPEWINYARGHSVRPSTHV